MSNPQSIDAETADLVRYWFEFDLTAYPMPDRPEGTVNLDGGSPLAWLLHQGAGVTGYDEADCLHLLSELAAEPIPPTTAAIRNVDVSTLGLHHVGNPSWRGVWFPNQNAASPTAP